MKITKRVLQQEFSHTALEKFVLRDILQDSKNHNGTFIQRLKDRLNDI